MNTIVYLMYGNRREYHLELTYSVLSAARFLKQQPDEIQIVLITTPDGRREDLPVRHVIIDDAEMARWMLDGKYNHAAKYQAILRAMDQFQRSVVLIDTDTYFTQHPAKLFERIGPGRALMCDADAPLGAHPEWSGLLARIEAPIAGYTVNAASTMFNSGIVGVDWSMRPKIAEVYELMRDLFAIETVFNIEQYAFSAVLDRHASVSICPDLVKHYWGFERRFVHAEIDDLFPQFSRELFERNLDRIRPLGIAAKPFPDRLRAKLLMLWRGAGKEYGFAYLSYLCALSADNAKLADVWANTALDALTSWGNATSERPSFTKRDFRKFSSSHLDGHAWMRPQTRLRWQRYWDEAGR